MIWKLIPGTNNYFVSDDGQVKSAIGKREKILSQWVDNKGYLRVKIVLNGKSTGIGVHRLVALGFITKNEKYDQVNHKDGNKKNNTVGNLEWCTSAENIKHAWANSLNKGLKGEKNSNSKLNEKQVYAIRVMYSTDKFTINELSVLFKVHKSTIYAILKNKNWFV